jgi:hypothetical protein
MTAAPMTLTATVNLKGAYKPGDANLDGEVDIFDALAVAMHVAEMPGHIIDVSDPRYDAADVNCDGILTIDDAVKIAKYDVELITEAELAQCP